VRAPELSGVAERERQGERLAQRLLGVVPAALARGDLAAGAPALEEAKRKCPEIIRVIPFRDDETYS
jgi:hypothetical protein